MERDDRYERNPMDTDADFRAREDAPVHRRPQAAPPSSPPPNPPNPPLSREEESDRARRDPGAIRAEDTEPYLALQYVARLFKIAALVVVVALIAEVVAGIILEGAGAILPLMAEVIRGVVLASILWGAGDLTLLLIDVGHDVRAARVLLGRLSARSGGDSIPVNRDR
jgi:hypothetical protein